MKTLCFGGTFNPIHYGHLLCTLAVAESSGFDRVLIIPSGVPPSKGSETDLAPARDRLTMCQLAVQGVSGFEVSEIELGGTDKSYTINTVRQLRSLGLGEIHWLIGADTVPRLPSWHEPEALLRETHFVVMRRPSAEIDWKLLPTSYQHLRQNVVQAPLIDITATDIRRRIALGKSIDFFVPPAVAAYIRDRRLYMR